MRQFDIDSPYKVWKRNAQAASISAMRFAPCGGVTCHNRTRSSASTTDNGKWAQS
jgi:hypothetical protein